PRHKAVLLRSGICLERFTYQPKAYKPPERLKVLTIGRLVEMKGIEYIIRAVHKLVKKGRDLELSIAGDGPLKEDLERLVKRLDLEDPISFLGEKTSEETAQLLREHHIFVASSVTAPNGQRDSAVNTLKEAMATGLPVVATRHGGIPELVEDGLSGFLVPERDEASIAEKIEWLADHAASWRAMGLAGRARVQRDYDIEKLNDRLVSLYSTGPNGPAPPRMSSVLSI
ncbi:MAG TPA: glycosyltransferase, partial [Candidatus Omnitrophota bacterium]|nr:glycosyltransferase [Candidatus Omnitrophota bacterium]